MTRTALVSYFFAEDALPLGESIVRGLQANGWAVERFHCQAESALANRVFKPARKLAKLVGADWDPAHHFGLDNEQYRNARMRERLRALKPDLLLVIRGTDYKPALLEEARTKGWVGKSVGWWVGYPESEDFLTSDMRGYDTYFSIHERPRPANVKFLDLLAYDGQEYYPVPGTAKNVPISFVGGNNPRRREVFLQLTDLPLHIYGPGWRKPKYGLDPALWRCVRASGIYGAALNLLYNRSKIVLNVTGWDPSASKGLNLRVLDVPATGAFLLTDYSEDLLAFFKPGVEIETWRSIDELRDKCAYYLSHDTERERIATAGLARVRTLEDYARKMGRLLRETGFADEASA